MNGFIKWFLLLLCLLALPAVLAAQPSTQTIALADDYTVTVPSDWRLTEANDGGFRFLGPEAILRINLPERLSSMGFDYAEDTNVVDVLLELSAMFEEAEMERDNVEKLRFGTRAAAALTVPRGNAEIRYMVVTLSSGEFALLTFVLDAGDALEYAELLNEIAASFDLADAATETETVEASPAAAIACTVSAEAANAAQLRVGPGTNRGAISFLPANTDVTVTGRIELEDGSIWFQLDKAEAAPNGTPAAELWVTEADVTPSGDCENVGETSAPPVIRAAPQVVASPGGEPGTGEAAPASTPAAGLLSPREGAYTLTLAPVINASCTGGANVPLNTAEVYEGEINYTYYIDVVDANSFYYGDDLYRRYPGSNSFDGTFTYSGGERSSARIDVLSPTSVHGEINHLFPLSGVTCSATLLFDAYRG